MMRISQLRCYVAWHSILCYDFAVLLDCMACSCQCCVFVVLLGCMACSRQCCIFVVLLDCMACSRQYCGFALMLGFVACDDEDLRFDVTRLHGIHSYPLSQVSNQIACHVMMRRSQLRCQVAWHSLLCYGFVVLVDCMTCQHQCSIYVLLSGCVAYGDEEILAEV